MLIRTWEEIGVVTHPSDRGTRFDASTVTYPLLILLLIFITRLPKAVLTLTSIEIIWIKSPFPRRRFRSIHCHSIQFHASSSSTISHYGHRGLADRCCELHGDLSNEFVIGPGLSFTENTKRYITQYLSEHECEEDCIFQLVRNIVMSS